MKIFEAFQEFSWLMLFASSCCSFACSVIKSYNLNSKTSLCTRVEQDLFRWCRFIIIHKIKVFPSSFKIRVAHTHTHSQFRKGEQIKLWWKLVVYIWKRSEFIAASFMCCFLSVLRVSIISSFLFSYSKLFNLSLTLFRYVLIMNSKKALEQLQCMMSDAALISWAWFTSSFVFIAYSPTNNIF